LLEAPQDGVPVFDWGTFSRDAANAEEDAVVRVLEEGANPGFEEETVERLVGRDHAALASSRERAWYKSSTCIEKDSSGAMAVVKFPAESVEVPPSRSVSRSESIIISTSCHCL